MFDIDKLTLFDEIKEYQLQNFWNRIAKGIRFKSETGKNIDIINPGVWNKEEGPDFKNAVIRIDGKEILGDVEIHLSEKDWFSHGHDKDSEYDNVVLHVIRRKSVTGQCLGIPTIVITDGIIAENNYRKGDKYPKGICSNVFIGMSDEKLHTFFINAGIARFKEKAELAADDILKFGINSALLKRIFDSLGYKKNRKQFTELFEKLHEYDIKSLTNRELNAAIWGESGFLPDPVQYKVNEIEISNFIKDKWLCWWKLRKADSSNIKWNLSGVRPQNHPCRRLAALDGIINKYGCYNIFDKLYIEYKNAVMSRHFWKIFKENIIIKDSIWDNYSSFNSKLNIKTAVLGEARALDITINVILPTIYAYEKINKFSKSKEVLNIYKELPSAQKNIDIQMATERWLIPQKRAKTIFKGAAAQQGVIYIHRNYCSKLNMNCAKCEVPELTLYFPQYLKLYVKVMGKS